MVRAWISGALAVTMAGCGGDDAAARPASAASAASRPPAPDELPALVTAELPFRYPAELYARKVQGNVTLKLFIDRDGRVHPDSIRVDQSSGYPSLDTAAVLGATALRFVPAKLHGDAIPVSILFPVYFRHPEARPLPGDTILNAGKSG